MPITSWRPDRVLGPVTSAARPAMIKTAMVARTLAPRGASGNLSRRTRVTFTGTMNGILHAPGVPYIYPVVKGSVPHEIKPRNARALKFPDNRFAVRAPHPGHAANPYLNKAAASFPTLYGLEASTRLRFGR